MTTTVNPATGEVAVELGGQTFRLRAAMRRVGELETQLGVTGLGGVQEKLSLASAGITFTALKCLCVSDNVEALDDLLYTEITPAIDAVWKALLFGLPEPKKKTRAATLTNGQQKSPGPDSEPLPMAS
jgi:hypothetical protein